MIVYSLTHFRPPHVCPTTRLLPSLYRTPPTPHIPQSSPLLAHLLQVSLPSDLLHLCRLLQHHRLHTLVVRNKGSLGIGVTKSCGDTCVRVCMCACVHVCVCACVHVCMCASVQNTVDICGEVRLTTKKGLYTRHGTTWSTTWSALVDQSLVPLYRTIRSHMIIEHEGGVWTSNSATKQYHRFTKCVEDSRLLGPLLSFPISSPSPRAPLLFLHAPAAPGRRPRACGPRGGQRWWRCRWRR